MSGEISSWRIAEVPSVIVPEETNLLLNPRHPAHGELVAEIVRPWFYDARLLPTARAAAARTATARAGGLSRSDPPPMPHLPESL